MEGADVTELLFADNTLIFAKNNESIEGLLGAVEAVSGIYGMKLYKGKCIEITIGMANRGFALKMDRK